MSSKFNKPVIDVSGWEAMLIHLNLNTGGKVTKESIRDIINSDIAKMGKQKPQRDDDTQEKYDHKYIKALFRRMKSQLDDVLAGTQEVEYRIDGAKSCFNVDAGLDYVQREVNNLDDLDKLLRDAMGEYKLKQLLDDVVAHPDDINVRTNMVIHELKQNGVEAMIDDIRASSIMKYYDKWGGDYHMDNSWWQPYTERLLKMAIIIQEIVLDDLRASSKFDEDEWWAEIDSDDITFSLHFEYEGRYGGTMDSRTDLVEFIKLYFEKVG